jgi:hypothetical protein
VDGDGREVVCIMEEGVQWRSKTNFGFKAPLKKAERKWRRILGHVSCVLLCQGFLFK